MKLLSTTIACLSASLLVGALAIAEEVRKVKLIFAVDGQTEPVTFEGDELTLGETRTLTTESGRPVTLTRTETGYSVDIDGKKLELEAPGPKHLGEGGFRYLMIDADDEDGEPGAPGEKRKKILITEASSSADADVSVTADGRKIEKRIHFVHGGEGGQGKPGEHVKVVVMGKDPNKTELKARLIASGVLDKLDEETRRKVLAAFDESER
jgi:hypothetical protein